MNQITLCESVGIDGEGFRQRLKGRGIRDCILILTPEGGPSFGLLHKEPSSSPFVEEEIRGNKGALNIDSCRIATTDSLSGGAVNSSGGVVDVEGWSRPWMKDPEARERPKAEKLGRFPANLVLIHSSECVYSGKKLIKGDPRECGEGKRSSGFVNIGSDKGAGGPNSKVYGNRDGTEEVDNWECVEHCPVGRLDSQSGVLKSGAHPHDQNIKVFARVSKGTIYGDLGSYSDRIQRPFESNSGGASRFFKQITSQEELQSYFESLTRQETK